MLTQGVHGFETNCCRKTNFLGCTHSVALAVIGWQYTGAHFDVQESMGEHLRAENPFDT